MSITETELQKRGGRRLDRDEAEERLLELPDLCKQFPEIIRLVRVGSIDVCDVNGELYFGVAEELN